jgi:hypothetical protein
MSPYPPTARSQDLAETTPRAIVSHELWRLQGSTDPLRGLAVETSFGYAFALELDGEFVLLHLQPSLEVLVTYAERIEIGLRAQGWRPVPSSSTSEKETL